MGRHIHATHTHIQPIRPTGQVARESKTNNGSDRHDPVWRVGFWQWSRSCLLHSKTKGTLARRIWYSWVLSPSSPSPSLSNKCQMPSNDCGMRIAGSSLYPHKWQAPYQLDGLLLCRASLQGQAPLSPMKTWTCLILPSRADLCRDFLLS